MRPIPIALLALALGCLFLAGCSSPEPLITTCEAESNIEPYCGFHNPEDLVLLPDGRTVITGQFGAMDGTKPGNMAVFDTGNPKPRVVFEAGDPSLKSETWGDPACPGPPPEGFSPHGIDLDVRPGGVLQLLVVNHGGREAVEFFEVVPNGAATRLIWRGCAIAPEDAYLNDVVHTPEGGFLATHMMSKESQSSEMLMANLLGMNVGWIYEWRSPATWKKVEGTDAPMPNGIELSQDGRHIYVNIYLGDEVRRIDRASGETTAVVDVAQPDNLAWSSDGRWLLVASHTGGFRDSVECLSLETGSCGMPFEILALQPETLERTLLLQHKGPPMGAATVALQVGDDLWLGTFAGDRVARVVGGAAKLP